MAYRDELEVDKLLVWNTKIPYKGKPRRSSNFSLMGSEWYLEFSYQKGIFFHVLSLYRATVGDEPQQIEFKVRIHVTNSNTSDITRNESFVRSATVREAETILWYSAETDSRIFEIKSSLYRSRKIQFVCRFCSQPLSAFQLKLGSETTEGPSDLECLSDDLSRLLEGGQLPDVRLNCGDRTFPAHRSVLAARSEVFAAMFRNKMAESETGVVDVKDFEPDVIRHFLQYLYSGKLTEELGDAVASLFAIANKYAVDSLKRSCTRWIVSNLTEGNCVEYLTVADLHGSEALKTQVVAFICGHPDAMLGEEWAEFSEKNPKLALEVHQSFVRSKTVK